MFFISPFFWRSTDLSPLTTKQEKTHAYMFTDAVLIVIHFINGTSTSLDEMVASTDLCTRSTDELEDDRPRVDSSATIFFVQNVQKHNFLKIRLNEFNQCWEGDVPSRPFDISEGGHRACHATAKSKHNFFITVLPRKPPNCWMSLPGLQLSCATAVHCKPHQELITLAASTSVSMGLVSLVVVVGIGLVAVATAAAASWFELVGSKATNKKKPLDSSMATASVCYLNEKMICPPQPFILSTRRRCQRIEKEAARCHLEAVTSEQCQWKANSALEVEVLVRSSVNAEQRRGTNVNIDAAGVM